MRPIRHNWNFRYATVEWLLFGYCSGTRSSKAHEVLKYWCSLALFLYPSSYRIQLAPLCREQALRGGNSIAIPRTLRLCRAGQGQLTPSFQCPHVHIRRCGLARDVVTPRLRISYRNASKFSGKWRPRGIHRMFGIETGCRLNSII